MNRPAKFPRTSWRVTSEKSWACSLLAVPAPSVFQHYFQLRDRFSLSHWDTMLLAACKEAGVTRLYSEDMDAGSEAAAVLAVLDGIGKSTVRSDLLGQLELNMILIAERDRPVRIQGNRDEMKVALGALLQRHGHAVRVSRRAEERHFAREVHGGAGVHAIELGGNDGCRVQLAAEGSQ